MLEMQNHPMLPMNSWRVEKRPTKNAFSGMMHASTSAYELVSHCTVVAETPVSAIMDGNAGERSVAFRMTRIVPIRSTAIIVFCCFSKSRAINTSFQMRISM